MELGKKISDAFTEKPEPIGNTVCVISVDLDTNFWAITPALNINLHSSTFEIEWLCLGIYFDFK